MPPVGSEFGLGDGGMGDKIFPGAPMDVNKFAAARDCCASNLESFGTSLRTFGNSGVPGAEGMGLMRVRIALNCIFRVYRLAGRLVTGFGMSLLDFRLLRAELNGVPGVPTDEGKGGTPGVPMLAESKGLKA